MSAHSMTPKTPAQAKQWFVSNGVTVREWSRKHGFHPEIVYSVLRGKTKGRFGQAHEIAIALGIKAAPESGLKQAA